MSDDITIKGLVSEVVGIVISIAILDICLRNITYWIFRFAMKIIS